ncbi:hypothetical protein [Thiolapillus sp.]|nr:hypothetical protein [Thiolapillus sp.]
MSQASLRPRDRFWGQGCPKIYHEAEETLVRLHTNLRRTSWSVV